MLINNRLIKVTSMLIFVFITKFVAQCSLEKIVPPNIFESDRQLALIEIMTVGECIKCKLLSTQISEYIKNDTFMYKNIFFVSGVIADRKKDVLSFMKDNTIYDRFFYINSETRLRDICDLNTYKFILVDKNLRLVDCITLEDYIKGQSMFKIKQFGKKIQN